MWQFFLKSNHWGSHIPSLWMVHTRCVFVATIHPSRTWMSGFFQSLWWNACVQRLDLGLYSHPKESEPMLTPREILLRGWSNPRHCIKQDSELKTLPMSYSSQNITSDFMLISWEMCEKMNSTGFNFFWPCDPKLSGMKMRLILLVKLAGSENLPEILMYFFGMQDDRCLAEHNWLHRSISRVPDQNVIFQACYISFWPRTLDI